MSAGSGPRPDVQVRPASAREFDRVAALFGLLLDHHAGAGPGFAPGPDVGQGDALRAWLGRAAADPDRLLVVAADARGQLLGFALAAWLERPPLFAETARGEVAHLFVRPEERRRGVGRALAEAALAWLRARGGGRVEVQVARANPDGRAFWSALGFAPAMDVLERSL